MTVRKAFTMIELIVVLTILAILAVGAWILINPMEQIAKSQDSTRASNASEIASSVARYVVTRQEYPWNRASESWPAAVRGTDRFYYYDPTSELDMGWVWNMVEAEEVKEGAAKKITEGNEFYVFKEEGSTSLVYVCFEPTSQMYKQQAADNCNAQNRSAPEKYREFDPCQTTDGVIPDKGTGLRNLLCVAS
jgi:prepilin-type N-terminal cleavage/methylation domain-containing protein